MAAREELSQAQSAMLNTPSNPMLGGNEKSIYPKKKMRRVA